MPESVAIAPLRRSVVWWPPARWAASPGTAVVQAVTLTLGLRIGAGLTAWAAAVFFPQLAPRGDWTSLLLSRSNPWWPFLGPWQRWDGLWYQHLAAAGYRPGRMDVAFFPLYPALGRALATVLGGNIPLALMTVSTLAYALGLYLLFQLVSHDFDAETAKRTLFYLSIAPLAFFFVAPYTESLFLALAAGTMLAARTQHFVLAGVLAAAATLCRVQGILLLVPVLVELLIQARRRQAPAWSWTVLLLPPAVLAAYYAYGVTVLDVPGGFTRAAAEYWGRRPVAPWALVADSVRAIGSGAHPEELLNLCAFLGGLAALPLLIWRMPGCYWAFTVAMLLPVAFQEARFSPMMSAARYLLPAFPFFVLLARAGPKAAVNHLLPLVSLPLMGLLLVFQVHFGFVA